MAPFSFHQRRHRSRVRLRLERLEARQLLSGYHFDFGTSNSPISPGYTSVPLVAYSATQGYGWANTSLLLATNRTYSDPLKRDFNNGHDGTFLVDLPNGTYDVQPTLGDAMLEHDNISLYLQGQRVATGLTTLPAQFLQPAYRVQVSGGQFSVRLWDNGGTTNPNFALDALDINLTAAPTATAGLPLSVAEGTPVTFLAGATGSTFLSDSWSFGDGTTTAGVLAPAHTYADDGVYTATLTVTDSWGASTNSSTTVTVSNVPPTATTAAYLSVVGQPVFFAAAVTDPSPADMAAGFTFSWNFGDGATSGLAAPSHAYTAAGIYPVTLTVQDKDGGSSTVATTATVDPSSVYQATSGVYALVDPNANILAAALNSPYVTGISLRTNWNKMEPADGVFDWSYLDNQIATAAAAGKKVSISVTAGIQTPSWVYAAGARAFTFVDSTSPTPKAIPVPWDAVFLAKWQAFVQALGARYAGNAALTHVKFTGINSTTEELQLPRSTGVAVSNGQTTWTTTNDVANWQAAGYTRQIMESAWRSMLDTFSRAFLTKQVALEIVPQGFPALDDVGNVIAGVPGDTQIVNDFIAQGDPRYGSQLIVQNNGLSDLWTSPQVSGNADRLTTGYQMLWIATGDTSYRLNGGTPLDAISELQRAVSNGLAAQARFLEIYSLDVQNSALQGVLANAQNGLAAAAVPTALITNLPITGQLPPGMAIVLGSMVADPLSASATGITYSWSVLKGGAAFTSGTGASFGFTPDHAGSVYVIRLTPTDAAGRLGPTCYSTLVASGAAGGQVVLQHFVATGADAGGGPDVRVFDARTGLMINEIIAYNPGFTGGVRVAVGDVTGDGIPDIITVPGPGGGPDVRVFSGATGALVREFMAYSPAFTGGLFVAVGDINRDGLADIITGPDASGGPDVRVFDGATGALFREFMAYNLAFTGGVRVAVGDVNGDSTPDIVTAPGASGGPDVRVFDGATSALIREFMAYNPAFTGGVNLATADLTGDGLADIVTAPGAGGGPDVRGFSGITGALIWETMAYNPAFTGGVRVTALDVNGDGRADIVTAPGASGGPDVRVFDGTSGALVDEFFAYDPAFTGGVFIGGH